MENVKFGRLWWSVVGVVLKQYSLASIIALWQSIDYCSFMGVGFVEVDQLCKYLKSSAGIGDGRLPCVCVCMCVCVYVCVLKVFLLSGVAGAHTLCFEKWKQHLLFRSLNLLWRCLNVCNIPYIWKFSFQLYCHSMCLKHSSSSLHVSSLLPTAW